MRDVLKSTRATWGRVIVEQQEQSDNRGKGFHYAT